MDFKIFLHEQENKSDTV